MPRPRPPRTEIVRRIEDGATILDVHVTWDRRLRASARWTLKDETIYVRVPSHLSDVQVDNLVDDVVERVLAARRRARNRNDHELETRARAINRQYFDGRLRWHTIRWVSNMKYRLGSCSDGGSTDGDIRISDRIKRWPDYVVDYIIAHELAHRKHANHSPEFWDYLARYPHTERARGFIEGIAYAEGQDPDDLI